MGKPPPISDDGQWVGIAGEWKQLSPDRLWYLDGNEWKAVPGAKPPQWKEVSSKPAKAWSKGPLMDAIPWVETDAGTVAALSIPQLEELATALRKKKVNPPAGAEAEATVSALQAEISRRKTQKAKDGHDSLLLAALLATGLSEVPVPMVLKSGERGLYSTPARLLRYHRVTRYKGGSRGVSLPIGNTRARVRLGQFNARPVSSSELQLEDNGVVALTTQRLAFIGNRKSVLIPYGKIVSIQRSETLLEIHREGKEAPDIFAVTDPELLAFHIALIEQDEVPILR